MTSTITVHPGDTLWGIARKAHVSLSALLRANPQIHNPNMIHPNEKVAIPGSKDEFVRHGGKSSTPTSTPPPAASGTNWVGHVMAHPNSIFKQQYRSRFNPTGPLSSGNCAPASLAMAIKAFGREPHGMNVEHSIERARIAMTGHDQIHTPTNETQLLHGARVLGLHGEHMNPGHLDAELRRGRMVVLTGRPVGAYRTGFSHYTNFFGMHAILVVGKNSHGYLVEDPLSRTGAVTLSAHQLAAYTAGHGSGTAVWR